jgi:hypothetical protein
MSKKPQTTTAPAKEVKTIEGRISRIHLFEYDRADSTVAQGCDVSVAVPNGTETDFWKLTLLGNDALGLIDGKDYDPKAGAYVQRRPPLAVGQQITATGQYTLEPWKSEKHGLVHVPTLKILNKHQVSAIVVPPRPKITLGNTTVKRPKIRVS